MTYARAQTLAGELHVRAPMTRYCGSWEIDGPVEVAVSPEGPWRYLREDWTHDAAGPLARAAQADDDEARVDAWEASQW